MGLIQAIRDTFGITGSRFDGPGLVPEYDDQRLSSQLDRVFTLMLDGTWRTLDEIHDILGDRTNSISARLCDLRKQKFGGFTVDRRRRGEARYGLWEYRLDPLSGHTAV